MSEYQLQRISAPLLIREYTKCCIKIQEYEEKIASMVADGQRKQSRRYTAPLKLFEKYKKDIEREAKRRNFPIDQLTGIQE